MERHCSSGILADVHLFLGKACKCVCFDTGRRLEGGLSLCRAKPVLERVFDIINDSVEYRTGAHAP